MNLIYVHNKFRKMPVSWGVTGGSKM